MSTFTPKKASADIGVYGLGVMGANLARNLARNGYATAVFNRTPARTDKLIAEHGDEATFVPASTLPDFVASLRTPRVAIMMVQAGPSTDAVMGQLAELMDEGDIIVDCGNSLFTDTIRREKWAAERGLHFVGAGVSGGEEGALWGPSIMPGGTPASYDRLGPMFEAIAGTYDGVPCCTYIGANGAGHFVKMVHNGIEYADMQVIAEAYTLLREGLGATPAEIADIFAAWNEATFARGASSEPAQRAAGQALAGNASALVIESDEARAAFIEDVRQALFASKIVAYSQGFDEIEAGAKEYEWGIDKGALARIWRAGCIIRAAFLDDITRAYEADPDLPLLLAAEPFATRFQECTPALRRVVAKAALAGVPIPVFASSLAYFDQIRATRLPAALIQGQRDFFGSHTYRRVDKEGVFHTLWAAPGRPEEQWS